MIKPRPTLLEKRLAWFSNHRLFSTIIISAAVVGGIGTCTDSFTKIVGLFKAATTSKRDIPINLTLRITNPGSKPRSIESICDFSLDHSGLVGTSVIAEGRVELVPIFSSSAPFTIPSNEHRDFKITMPNIPAYQAILEQGGTNLYIPIRPTDTKKVALAATMFQRSVITRFFVPVDLAEAPIEPLPIAIHE